MFWVFIMSLVNFMSLFWGSIFYYNEFQSFACICSWRSYRQRINRSSSCAYDFQMKAQAKVRPPSGYPKDRDHKESHTNLYVTDTIGAAPLLAALCIALFYACIYFAVSVPLITTWPRRPCAIPDYSNCVDSPAPWKCHSEYIICSNGLKTMSEVCSIPARVRG